MMSRIKNNESRIMNLVTILIFVSCFLLPNPVSAQEFGLIVCNGPDCTFADLIELARNLVNAMIIISTFLATAAFAYAGMMLLGSGGNPGQKDKAKQVFASVMKGYLWILAAWLLIYTISTTLLKSGFSIL